ncbi:MAG: FHA domain-containing protein [Anaerolineaceae bacterium]|nr:FHA domain-containing protein [Anaerolineaceae bacterium]
MAYGRLDVFWPEGQFMTFPLVENSISVGRSTGNRVALETNTISRYHFSLTHDGQKTFITDMDSANGTFVDGERLAPNTPRELDGGDEIQIGDLRLIYHQLDEMATQPMKAVEETTQRIEVAALNFRLDVIGPPAPFSPGAHMSAEVNVTNTSAEAHRYRIDVTGMPSEWIRLDRTEILVEPQQSEQILINFRPVRRSDSRPGDYKVQVRVYQADKPELKLDAQMVVRVLPFSGFGMALEKPVINRGEHFRLHLHNQGSAPLPLNVTCRAKDNDLRFVLPAPQSTLMPGARFILSGSVVPQKPLLWGKPRSHTFDIKVTSGDAAHFLAVARAKFIEKPMLPAWTPLALAGAAIVGIAAVLVVLAILFRPVRPPQITTFTVNKPQVAQGEDISLSWVVQDASNLSLSVNSRTVIERISTETTGLTLDTSGLSGNVVLELVGENGTQKTSAVQTITVYQPLGQITFTSKPDQLIRYVVQNLTISWSVPGAIKTRLTGLETFTNTPLQSEYGAQGDLTGLAGIPDQALHLVLYAEDTAGNQQQQVLDIPVINPECLPAGPPVTLYNGPDVRYQVVGTVPAGAVVVVDAQDGSGQWLRARLQGGLSGWGIRSEFACAQTFNTADLVKELNVPTLPPATLTPVPTPTPTTRPVTAAPAMTLTPSASRQTESQSLPTLQPTASG